MLTQKAKYGLRATALLAARCPKGGTMTIAELAQAGHIPPKFLEAILLDLKRHGFLASRRGKSGGYALIHPAETITVGDLIRALDGPLAPIPCASMTAYRPCVDCADPPSCDIRRLMRRVRDAMAEILDRTTLAEFAASGESKLPELMAEMR
ncbi:RrF2 family transcriptional regulator [Neoroseomonas lacus]|uniref:Rrf2 family transcriptional regulator n=1 Tax=Neoroseomonas lacus TaxID=287609 RepID=A0A917KCZ0_9PROT|nr:Rrf2 family transcriptional regulator [Neoroseomonas lacus]GGJ07367.1 Rrf2 family transcriptional regulator [Neoroseomonas lacus]